MPQSDFWWHLTLTFDLDFWPWLLESYFSTYLNSKVAITAKLLIRFRSNCIVAHVHTACAVLSPTPSLDNIRLMVIVWRLRGNIIRTALCWIVWNNVHSPQHTFVSSSYRSNRLGLSHWDTYAVRRNGCLELYYCNVVECMVLVGFKPDFDDQPVSFNALALLIWLSGL